jgi:prepilin-type N-terminal cleavage/methylation domain-containing protein
MLVFLQQQLRLWSSMASNESGFTLIELMVTMLILSVLAAFALPAFGSSASKARDSRAKVTAHAAEVAMESCMVDSLGLYSGCDVGALRALDPSLPKSPALKVTVPAKGTSYTITVQSDPKTQTFQVKRSAKGVLTFPCKKAGVGNCPESGVWALASP